MKVIKNITKLGYKNITKFYKENLVNFNNDLPRKKLEDDILLELLGNSKDEAFIEISSFESRNGKTVIYYLDDNEVIYKDIEDD